MIVIRGGPEQLPIIKRLLQRGFEVILFDGNPEAMGRSLVRYFHAISTRDYQSIIATLKSQYKGHKLVGCTYMITETCLETVYRIAQEFNFQSTYIQSIKAK